MRPSKRTYFESYGENRISYKHNMRFHCTGIAELEFGQNLGRYIPRLTLSGRPKRITTPCVLENTNLVYRVPYWLDAVFYTDLSRNAGKKFIFVIIHTEYD